VNKIMEYEKKDRKKINLVITNENIGEILKWVVETHKKRLKENKQRIKITGTYDLSIWLDKNQFVQIVQNLIWNFLRYSWKKTLLKIIINKNYIEFTDNWIWISTAKIPFLTEKFYQWNIEKTWTIDNRWLGVWLSIISKIIISHNWKYEIKSDTNKWFSFKIYI
jgi:K+-sensing histidine kinase KdpD